MLKIIAAATLLAGASTMVAMPASDSSDTSRSVVKSNRIATRADMGVRNYPTPRLNGNRVPFCLSGGRQCGKDAADAFCRGNGFEEAVTFQRDSVQSNSASLRFRQIKCWHPQAVVDARPNIVIKLTGALLTSNAAVKSNRL